MQVWADKVAIRIKRQAPVEWQSENSRKRKGPARIPRPSCRERKVFRLRHLQLWQQRNGLPDVAIPFHAVPRRETNLGRASNRALSREEVVNPPRGFPGRIARVCLRHADDVCEVHRLLSRAFNLPVFHRALEEQLLGLVLQPLDLLLLEASRQDDT